ncbi:hypothetical protein GCM10008090_22220 [Arenicella chitinivorans]|uniref:Cell division coordinator CpoB n=1 Tax=Arenicella chitinivorans TaxID=1329800 RepID=A0A918VNS1_9GAMM|nr:tol-pal system protein YbgF [Arenicella chitinivorans]GHA11956.1 hypothetical protein GCM10008090_22220 [Arenicella chitinivorans]
MRRVKTLLKLVGVALCVAPILSVAHAQQNAPQANLLLEIQQLRLEIAELRDMVERQQFQLRKLQRSQGQSAAQSSTGAPINRQAPINQTDSPSMVGPEFGTANVPSPSMRTGEAAGVDYRSVDADADYPSEELDTGGVNQSPSAVDDGEFAQPSYSTGTSAYPPVVDRSIGTNTVPQTSQSVVPQLGAAGQTDDQNWQASPNRQNPNNQGLNNRPRPSVYQQTQPNPVYQTPRSDQSLPSATAQSGGGVIAIPQEASNRESEYGRDYRPVDTTASNSSDAGISSVMSESDYYSQGFDLMKQSKFDEAVTVFEKQLEVYPKGDSADDAHYWIAEAMYVSRNLDVAKQHLHTLIQDYPQSRRVPDAMLKKAYIEQQLGNKIEARILFQEIVNFFPKSDAAIAAKNRLADSN